MAHYAVVDENNIVIDLIAGIDEDNLSEIPDGYSDWESFYTSTKENATCIRTSYNTRGGVHYVTGTEEPSSTQEKAIRGNYAVVGGTYDPVLDVFLPPKLYDYFIYDEANINWKAPIDKPNDGFLYYWDDSVYQNDNTDGWVRIYRPDEE